MKKSDLKPGMVIEYAFGGRALVTWINNEIYFINLSHTPLSDYDDNLKTVRRRIVDIPWDIVKIYEVKNVTSFEYIFSDKNLRLLWVRPKEVVITMDEIAEKFGVKPEQIRIKK